MNQATKYNHRHAATVPVPMLLQVAGGSLLVAPLVEEVRDYGPLCNICSGSNSMLQHMT
jgi:hypothetical protein